MAHRTAYQPLFPPRKGQVIPLRNVLDPKQFLLLADVIRFARNANIRSKGVLQAYARYAKLDHSYLRNRFSKMYGKTGCSSLLELAVWYAQEELLKVDSEYAILEIGE